MAKYIAKNVDWICDEVYDEDFLPLNVVSCDDSTLTPTGLVDADGVPLWRLPNPIGFGRKFEW